MTPATLVLAAAGLLCPGLAAVPWSGPVPVLWETPASLAVPPPSKLTVDPDLEKQIEEVRAVNRRTGPAAAAAALARADDPTLMLLRAGLKRVAGDLSGAKADYEAVLASKNRTAPRALAFSGLESVLRQKIAAGEKSLYEPLVSLLKSEWLNEEALALLREVVAADPEVPAGVKERLRAQEPILALRLGRYDQAADLWAAPGTPSELKWLAETELRRGRFRRAAELRLGAPARPGGPGLKPDPRAAFVIMAGGGLYEEALALAEKYPALKKAPDYGWRLGLAALAARDYAGARVLFEPLTTSGGPYKAGALYFLGRALDGAGLAAEAGAAYARAAKGPFGYYRILAEGRLEKQGPTTSPAALFAPLLSPGPSGLDRDSQGFHLWITEKAFSGDGLELAGEALARAGAVLTGDGPAIAALNGELAKKLALRDWAGLLALRRANHAAFRNLSPAARKLWPPLAAAAAARLGQYRLAVSLLSGFPGEGGAGLKKWSHPLIFSRPALEAWRRYGLSPALLLAVIRTESAYQADIISASNARGLMQLLPATAARVAEALREDEPGTLALFDPAVNIRYGSWYLAALIDGFGHEALALAGYNGGPYNIRSLILAKPGLPLDIFIESLWANETVKYVKRIIESRYIYEEAYLGRAVRPDLTVAVPRPRATLPPF